MSRTTLLFIDHATDLGGAEHSLLLLMAQLQASDSWQPHLACPPGTLADAARAQGVSVHELVFPRLRGSPRFFLDGLRIAQTLAHLARDINAAILHSNTIRATIYAALATHFARRPLLWHMRDFWLGETAPARPQLDAWGKKMLCAASRRVIANSQATALHLPCHGKTTVVPNGILIEHYKPGLHARTFRQQWGIPENAPVVGMVGRLRPWKGQATFLEMAARVRYRRSEVRFLLVGGNPFGGPDDYARNLQAQVEALQLNDAVIFTGHLEDIRPALAAMSIFVHPGQPEPFGLVNIEAMAMEKPVVAFAHGALPEIITPETGILEPPGDTMALAESVLSLLDDPDRAQTMGQAGRRRVAHCFTIQKTAAQIEALYRQVLETL